MGSGFKSRGVHHWENSLRLAETRAGGCFVLSGTFGVQFAIAGLAAIAGPGKKKGVTPASPGSWNHARMPVAPAVLAAMLRGSWRGCPEVLRLWATQTGLPIP